MSREREVPRVPDLLLEQYRLGELPPTEMSRIGALARSDETLNRRLLELAQSDEEVRRCCPPEWLAERVRDRLGARRRRERQVTLAAGRRWVIGAALATAMAVLVLIEPQVLTRPGRSAVQAPSGAAETGDQSKGRQEPALIVYRKEASGTRRLADGDVARAGDLLRIGYWAAGRAYGVILSIDGTGTVTQHLPASGDGAAPLQTQTNVLLEHSFELDAAPRWECFWFVTSRAPFEVAPILAAARHAAPASRAAGPPVLLLPTGFEQATFIVRKEGRQ
jgi:hypothetical protein